MITKKKPCLFCINHVDYIDYKDLQTLKRYTPNVQIKPRYYSGVCLNHQKRLSKSIKYARFMGLLAFTKTTK